MALGHPSVAACQEAISASEFVEWLAYDRIAPIPDGALLREYFGNIVAAILNSQRSKRSQKVVTWRDIYPDCTPKRAKSNAELLAQIEVINVMFGGRDERQKPPIA